MSATGSTFRAAHWDPRVEKRVGKALEANAPLRPSQRPAFAVGATGIEPVTPTMSR